MEISIPVETKLLTSDVTDTTDVYDPQERRLYYGTDFSMPFGFGGLFTAEHGLRLQDHNEIYEWVKDSFVPPLYDASDTTAIQAYKVHDIIYKDGFVQVVTSTGTKLVPSQPETYTSDNTFTFGTWSKYWSMIGSGYTVGTFEGFQKTVNGVTHRLFKHVGSPTNWRYEIVFKEFINEWLPEQFDLNATDSVVHRVSYSSQPEITVKYGSDVRLFTSAGAKPIPHVTVFTGSDGRKYRCGSIRRTDPASGSDPYDRTWYGIQAESTKTEVRVLYTDAHFYTTLDSDSVVESAICKDNSNCNNMWLGKTFVLRNGNLYVRTAMGTEDLTAINVPQYKIANRLEDLNRSGFVYLSPIAKYIPFDGKQYTKVTAAGVINFRVQSQEKFNCVALAGVIANLVTLRFKDSNGNQVGDTAYLTPNNKRDMNGRLPDYKTTTIGYAYEENAASHLQDRVVEAGGTVEIEVKGGYIEVGSILLGLSMDAGFTNVVFQNEFVDLSPNEQDQWGNILYKKGVRYNVYTGKVDVRISEYDMMNKLMISIGGQTVIVDGSDNTTNLPTDSRCIFNSTEFVGRISNFKLQTNMKDKQIGDMASYTFTVKENV